MVFEQSYTFVYEVLERGLKEQKKRAMAYKR